MAIAAGALAAFADPPPPPDHAKQGAWQAAVVPAGKGWWCNRTSCHRDADMCGDDNPCTKRRRAWAFTGYLLADGNLDAIWFADVAPNRAACEASRREDLGDDAFTNLSSCTQVGDRVDPNAKHVRLPRGRGWWCFHYILPIVGTDASTCLRTRTACDDAIARLSVPTSALGEITISRGCRRARQAWATEIGGDEPFVKIVDSEAECSASLIGGPCQRVK